ncbi:MAG: hypothetical protein BSOLF_2039 [Candidatus Carbobacillus altaicus]|uniref:Uncharacterized protein n=1 Tax=Candidatus Carbonibacillus altaicus TaxID=2163959 RepID=A0A2R6Y3B7_9BACL|nr:MAG: hypothetical protein BSOLF_2039 [Candidatus Carbobacillus altaicus]
MNSAYLPAIQPKQPEGVASTRVLFPHSQGLDEKTDRLERRKDVFP